MLKAEAFMTALLILGTVTGAPILGRLPVLWELWPGGSTRTHISRKHLETSGLTLRGKNDLINIPNNILKNGKLEGYSFKMAWLNNLFNVVGKKSQLKKMEQLQIYFKNSHKYRDTRPPLAYITPETNLMLKVEESYFQKSQETLETILVLRLVKEKIVERKKPTEIRMLQKKKYTNNMDSVLSSIKERKFSKQSTNIYNKNQHRIFFDEEALNIGRKDRLMGFKKYGQQQRSSFLRTEMVTVQERKTTKKSVTENQKFPFPFVFTYQRSSNSILKIFLAHNTVLSNIEDKPQFAKIKFFRNRILIRIQGSILQAKKSKSDKNGLDVSSKIYNMELSVINQVLSSITSAMGARCELLSSQVYTCKAKSTVYMMERLKHLMIVSQRAHFLFNTAQKGFRISVLKRQMARKHHDTKESLPTLLYLHKHAFQGPSVIERTKRSTKDERVVPIREQTVPISVSYLKRLTSALVAGATLFGLALGALALAGCCLYYKRRQLGEFISVLKGEESPTRTPSTDAPPYPPFSLSQNFHFQPPQESSKNQTPVATVTETFSKAGSDMVTVKEIYRNSDTEGSLNASYKGFSIRSRAYVSQSRSSGSIRSVFDDAPNVSSAQHSSADEIIKENEFSVLTNTNPKEKTSVSDSYLPFRCSCDYQKYISCDVKKPWISKSKSENDIIMSSSSKEIRAFSSLTILH